MGSKATTTTHSTLAGEIQYMRVNSPFVNDRTGKEEFSIRLALDENDPAIAHLREVSPKKIDTDTNRDKMAGTGKLSVHFSTGFAPTVLDASGTELKDSDIPRFDGRTDTGTAGVSYSVITYDGLSRPIVKLNGVKIKELNIVPKEEGSSTQDLADQLAKI